MALGGSDPRRSCQVLRSRCSYDMEKAYMMIGRMRDKWSTMRVNQATLHQKATILGHLELLRAQLDRTPALTRDPTALLGIFAKTFVPSYTESLTAGKVESNAKTGVPAQQFIGAIMAATPAMEASVVRKIARAHESADKQAEKGHHGFIVKEILGAQVQPNSRAKKLPDGQIVCAMRLLVHFDGCNSDSDLSGDPMKGTSTIMIRHLMFVQDWFG